MSEGVRCFSSDHSLHSCGQSVVQATTLALVYAGCVLVNAHLAGPFVITNFLLLGTTASTARRHTGWKILDGY